MEVRFEHDLGAPRLCIYDVRHLEQVLAKITSSDQLDPPQQIGTPQYHSCVRRKATIMSGTSSVGTPGVYEAGDQRNAKKSDINTADRFKEGKENSHLANDSSL